MKTKKDENMLRATLHQILIIKKSFNRTIYLGLNNHLTQLIGKKVKTLSTKQPSKATRRTI